jgi:hypothetical protein
MYRISLAYEKSVLTSSPRYQRPIIQSLELGLSDSKLKSAACSSLCEAMRRHGFVYSQSFTYESHPSTGSTFFLTEEFIQGLSLLLNFCYVSFAMGGCHISGI